MSAELHPKWFPEAVITCSCGNSWTTGATVPAIRTEICSNCHPFYTGEQRIVDTEGQVDRFLGRLRQRDRMRTEAEERLLARTPSDLPLAELGIGKRFITIFAQHDIAVAQDVLDTLENGGDEALLAFPGIGRKVLADLKRALRHRGYTLPMLEAEGEAAEVASAGT